MSSQKTGRGADQVTVRLPPGMRDALHEVAAMNGRSLNSEVIAALTWHLSRHLSDEEETRQDLMGLVQQFVDIVRFETERREQTGDNHSD